jgi:tetratricopeptide (TPR) repeat protein
MNRFFLQVVFGCAVATAGTVAVAQQPAQPAAPAQQAPAQGAPAQKKEIKDPAEYNAYVGAVQQTDPNAKISGLEAFVTQYPNSVMKEDALEALMGAYQQTNNVAKMGDAAQRVLAVNPNNVRALALLTYSKTAAAQQGQNVQQNLADAKDYGQKGIEALKTFNKPDTMSDADYATLKKELTGIFDRGIGQADLGAKDYPGAATALRAAVEASPNDVNVIYPLAMAYLSENPADSVNGLWFIARAANLAPTPAGQQQIEKYGKAKYTKYHGSDQGWTDLMAQTKTTPLPPAGFTIAAYVPPTPADQAADLVKTKKIEDMSFAEWQLVLSEGKPEDAEKVWTALKGKPLQMQAHIISVDSDTNIKLAGSQDDIDAKKADIDLTFGAKIPAKLMPKPDTDLQFQGTPVSYEPKPFVMTMKEGALLESAAPAHHTTTHKKPTQ